MNIKQFLNLINDVIIFNILENHLKSNVIQFIMNIIYKILSKINII